MSTIAEALQHLERTPTTRILQDWAGRIWVGDWDATASFRDRTMMDLRSQTFEALCRAGSVVALGRFVRASGSRRMDYQVYGLPRDIAHPVPARWQWPQAFGEDNSPLRWVSEADFATWVETLPARAEGVA